MKIKTAIALAISLFSVGLATSVSAHDLRFKTLMPANGVGATDVWEVGCQNSQRLVAQVKDHDLDTNKVVLILYKDGKAVTSTDLVGEDSDYSPLVSLSAGSGTYSMMVGHNKPGFKLYSITYHCENASGSHTPTTVPSTPVQDQ